MKFDYNANLDDKERMEQVAIEIKRTYPLIGYRTALLSAAASTPIDDKPTNDDKFDRYYFILQYLKKNNVEYLHVFNDMFNLYEEGFTNNIYNQCMGEIINFVSGKTNIFPELSSFYE